MTLLARRLENDNRRLLRARDLMDREYRQDLDVPRLAATAAMSVSHFIRSFKAAFGETPHRYLQRRRVERSMYMLRSTQRSVTEICMEVGFSSLGTFSRTFSAIVGMSPTEFRSDGDLPGGVPTCFVKVWTRPSNFGEAKSFPSP